MVYLDSSALVKLVAREVESEALRTYLEAEPDRVSSVIASIEVSRAALRKPAVSGLELLLADVGLIDLTSEICSRAASLEPASIRTLDAIHVATALDVGDDLTGFVTYDSRQADVARANGLDIFSPS